MTVNERLQYVINLLYAGNKRAFAKAIGVSATVIENVVGSRQGNPSFEVMQKIMFANENINCEWLITGKGEMLKPKESNALISYQQDIGAPYYNVDFVAGFDLILNDQTVIPEHNIVFSPAPGIKLWCNATGNSMADVINHGDIIGLGDEVSDWRDILFGEIYAVVTKQFRTIKVIRKSQEKDSYKFVPINKEYDEQDIRKDSILKIFAVLCAIKKFF